MPCSKTISALFQILTWTKLISLHRQTMLMPELWQGLEWPLQMHGLRLSEGPKWPRCSRSWAQLSDLSLQPTGIGSMTTATCLRPQRAHPEKECNKWKEHFIRVFPFCFLSAFIPGEAQECCGCRTRLFLRGTWSTAGQRALGHVHISHTALLSQPFWKGPRNIKCFISSCRWVIINRRTAVRKPSVAPLQILT